jgi:predicted heme/steroid binding protein
MTATRGPLRRYYTPYEVAQHNLPGDCWVTFLGSVYDITDVIKENPGTLIAPLIAAAGKDISDWFDPSRKDLKRHICPQTHLERYYTPMGRFVHVPPIEPVGNWDTGFGLPWWKDDRKFRIGHLSQRTRVVRIKNVLSEQEDMLEVPCEEKLVEIRERYLTLNWHAGRQNEFDTLVPTLCIIGPVCPRANQEREG